jgi:protein SCO1/2
MRAIGYRSWRDPRTLEIAHAAGLVLLNVRGDISQYLFGVAFDPHTLRLALIDASAGRIGSLVDRFVLLCCSFDPSTGHYSLLISRVLQWLGGLTALGFAVFIALLRRSELRRGRALQVP